MKTALQNFAEQVTADVIGAEYSVLAAATEAYENGEWQGPIVGIDIISIMALVEMIMAMVMEMIDNCPANDDYVRRSIQNPRIMQRIRVRIRVNRACRAAEPRWRREAQNITSAMLTRAASASDSEVDAVVDQCRNDVGEAAEE